VKYARRGLPSGGWTLFLRCCRILRSGLLNKHELQRASLGGHPEGHPKVMLEEIRRAGYIEGKEKQLLIATLNSTAASN